jgi:SOS-response transcriptional repressor LexA
MKRRKYKPWKSGGGCGGTKIEDADRDEAGRVALTRQQRKVYAYLRRHIAEHGWAPTTRELVDAFGWATPNAAVCHLAAIARKGWIVRGEGMARAIRIVGE